MTQKFRGREVRKKNKMKYNSRKEDKRQRWEEVGKWERGEMAKREGGREGGRREGRERCGIVSKVLDEKCSPCALPMRVWEWTWKLFLFSHAVQMDMLTLGITRLPSRTFYKDTLILFATPIEPLLKTNTSCIWLSQALVCVCVSVYCSMSDYVVMCSRHINACQPADSHEHWSVTFAGALICRLVNS